MAFVSSLKRYYKITCIILAGSFRIMFLNPHHTPQDKFFQGGLNAVMVSRLLPGYLIGYIHNRIWAELSIESRHTSPTFKILRTVMWDITYLGIVLQEHGYKAMTNQLRNHSLRSGINVLTLCAFSGRSSRSTSPSLLRLTLITHIGVLAWCLASLVEAVAECLALGTQRHG